MTMENEKEKRQPKKQCFYFNENGQLVVESNKGVWVDGEKYVKMYGDFTCNAKTMGEIIYKLKGITVEVGVNEKIRETKDSVVDDILDIREHDINHYCVLGADRERVNKYENELAKNHYETQAMSKLGSRIGEKAIEIERLQQQKDEDDEKIYDLKKSIENFNSLPWWKRMFKKVEVK